MKIANREAERQVALDKKFLDLGSEFRVLLNRRASLGLNNVGQITAFNRDAAEYARRLQLARDEKAHLPERAPRGLTLEER